MRSFWTTRFIKNKHHAVRITNGLVSEVYKQGGSKSQAEAVAAGINKQQKKKRATYL